MLMISDLRDRIQNNIKHIASITFFVGFAFDMFLLPDVNDSLSRYIGLLYVICIAIFLIIRERVALDKNASQKKLKFINFLTYVVAYFSGSALSFVFVYAFRSAALVVSWPIFVILFACMLINELVSSRRVRIFVEIAVFIISLTFYTLFNLPFLLNKQNDFVFFGGLFISLSLSFLFIKAFNYFSNRSSYIANYSLAILIPSLIGGLYILNLMPAVPLSIRNVGIYHYVERCGSDYCAKKEDVNKNFLSNFSRDVQSVSATDNSLYFFASVRAPAALTAPISHVWEYYNDNTKTWETRNKLTFNIYGGREDGYRAYSNVNNPSEGLWRVTVKVDNNRIVGRHTFKVQKSDSITLKEVKI